MIFGEKVKYLRENLEMSQLELAERIGCGTSTISRYESGIYNSPRQSFITKLAKVLETTEYYLTNIDEVQTTCHDRRYDQAKTIGNLIKNYRKINQFDQKELAELLDIDQPTMSRIETGNMYILDSENEDLKNKIIDLFPDIKKDIARILDESIDKEGEVIMETIKETFGKRLERIRTEHGLTLRELAIKAGLSKSTVYQYEIGKYFPTEDSIIALAKVFNISTEKLMENIISEEYKLPYTEMGSVIARYRSEAEMSRKKLADEVGCNYNKICRLEKGEYYLFNPIYKNIKDKLFKMFPNIEKELIGLDKSINSVTENKVDDSVLEFKGVTLGERLKELRESRGCTNIQFAKLTGKSAPALYCYETDQRLPDRDTLDVITKACGISTDKILDGLNIELVKSYKNRPRIIDRSNNTKYQYSALGDIIRDYRVKADLSQPAVAKVVGVSNNYIYKFEAGQLNLIDPKYHGIKVKIFELIPGLEKAIHEFIHKENPSNKILGDSVKLEPNKISQQKLDLVEVADNMYKSEVALDKNQPSTSGVEDRTKSIMEGRYTKKMLSGFEKNYPEDKSPAEKLNDTSKNIPDEIKEWSVDKLPDTIDVLFGDCKGVLSLKKIKEETIRKFIANKTIDGILYDINGENSKRYVGIETVGKYENIIHELQEKIANLDHDNKEKDRLLKNKSSNKFKESIIAEFCANKVIDGFAYDENGKRTDKVLDIFAIGRYEAIIAKLEETIKEKDSLIKNEACNMDEYLSKKSFIDAITKPSDVDDDLDTTDDSEELESLISHQDIFEGIDNDVKGNIKILIFDYIYNKLLNIIAKNESIKGKDVVRILDQEIKWYTDFIGDDILKTKFDNLKNDLLL